MAESAAGAVVEVVVDKSASWSWKELGRVRSVYTDFEKLKSMLSRIKAVLDDAENRSISDRAVSDWLKKLRDAAFDADDVVDEFETEALQRRIESSDRLTAGKVRDFFSSNNPIAFRYKMAPKIREIRERFSEIAKENKDFDSVLNSDLDRPVNRGTESLAIESAIYGRDDEKNQVIQILVEKDTDKNISILPIVGVGGIGKTTLAQIVYHNDEIDKHFELRIWVCVGEKLNEEVVLQKMIVQVKGEPINSSTLETISSLLGKEFRTKRFLLVLDDLCNEDEFEWEKLKTLVVHAKLGSKIIVTTRSERVASVTGTISPYRLQGLGIDHCWTLFKQRAFRSEREEEDNREFEKIGWEFIERCGGLPLAVKALGSLMSSYTRVEEWAAISKDSEIGGLPIGETGILPILKLSYDHLPSHLKRCFTYCSMLPKDHEFEIKNLIQLWMAEGLIDMSRAHQNAEDIGKIYFDNLLSRSFFQDVQMDEYNNPLRCKMHDLVHDLACSITKDEALAIEGDTKSISHGCRYLSVTRAYVSSIDLKTTYEAKKLRSLILLGAEYQDTVDMDMDEFFFNVTKNFTRLRALDLKFSSIKKLSDRMSKLKHLRFLDLSYTKITALPTSITRLYNLQTLNVDNCHEVQELPEGIGNLYNLRYMDISWCIEITTLPTSITKLYNLQTLNVGDCWKLRELPEGIGNLCNLRHMDISRCTKITTLPTSITKLSNLQTLKLHHCENLRELPEGISNLGNLRHLDISESCSLSCIPRGLGQLSDLETLPMFIVSQENGCTIAELQHLNSIRGRLVIKNLYHVKDPNEAMQANLKAKTRLNYLALEWNQGLDEMQEQSSTQVAENVFERLQPHYNLEWLHINYYMGIRLPNWMARAELVLSSFPNLVELELRLLKRCEHLPPLGRLPLLKNLILSEMHAVKRIGEEFYGDGDGNAFPSLEAMILLDMPNLEAWCAEPRMAGRKMTAFPCLTNLSICSCPKLTVQPCIPSSVEALLIQSGDESLLSAGNLAGLSKLKKLGIVGYGVLSSSSSVWWDGLQYLTALEELEIWDCQKLTCLPEVIMYLPSLHTLYLNRNRNLRSLEWGGRKQQQQPTPFFTSLQTLSIEGADTLTALPEWLGGLTLLQDLRIYSCPQLAMLPEGMQHLTALQYLRIDDCPQLQRRCKKETGEDWLKIAHIPEIVIFPREEDTMEEEDGEQTSKRYTFITKFLSRFGLAHCSGHD